MANIPSLSSISKGCQRHPLVADVAYTPLRVSALGGSRRRCNGAGKHEVEMGHGSNGFSFMGGVPCHGRNAYSGLGALFCG